MAEEILVNVTTREVRVAVLENHLLQDIYIERNVRQSLVGNLYKGKVTRLLPGIQAAFIDIGLERAAFLHAKDIAEGSLQADIRDILRPGQELLVQVYKDPLGSKGARLTTQFTIPSRYVVFTPHTQAISISHKVTDEEERQRLSALLTPDQDGGYILRTAAVGVTQAKVEADRQFLQKLWADILARAKEARAGDIVFTEIPLILRVLRDLNSTTVERIRVDDIAATEKMRGFAAQYAPELTEKIVYYAEKRPIFDIDGVEDELQKALQRRIMLKSGGYLVFDQTEAMTTIDINTGSYLGKGKNQRDHEETIYFTNREAVDVIARQIRLRNLGGIIIIDFIDMMNAANRTDLIELLTKALAKDTARTEISELSSLGLVQMTRKRTRESLEHILCVSCPLCQRRGSLKSLQTVCYDIFRELKRVAFHFPSWQGFSVIASKNVVNYLLNYELTMFKELEAQLGKPLQVHAAAAFIEEQYEILPLGKE